MLAGIIGGATVAGASGMIGRFFWRLGVFLAAIWTVALLALALVGEPARSAAEMYGSIATAIVVGDLVILGLAAGLAWVCGGAPWARS